MSKFFDEDRHYVLGDPELDLIGARDRLAQWRYQKVGPDYFKIGRKIIYAGTDLNAWMASRHSSCAS